MLATVTEQLDLKDWLTREFTHVGVEHAPGEKALCCTGVRRVGRSYAIETQELPIWTLWYVTVSQATGAVREGFIRSIPAVSRAEAVRKLAEHYAGSGLALVLHDVMAPMSDEMTNYITSVNAWIKEHGYPNGHQPSNINHQQSRSVGPRSGRGGRARLPAEAGRAVPAGV